MKTLLLIFVLVLAFAKTSYCFENQTIENASNINSDKPKDVGIYEVATTSTSEDTIYTYVEDPPEFVKGGQEGLLKFIAENMSYPIELPKNVKTKCYIRFIVGKDGSVINPTVIRSGGDWLDKEALRVIRLLPKFKAGKQNGKPLDIWYVVPIAIDLSE